MNTQKLRRGAAALLIASAVSLIAADVGRPEKEFQVVTRQVVQHGDHKITVNRIRPPVLKPILREDLKPTAEQLATDKRRETKRQIDLQVSATVFDDGVTELRWKHNGRSYHGFSNVNFLHFVGTGDLETTDTVYNFGLWMSRCTPTENGERSQRSQRKDLEQKNADYVVDEVQGGPAEEDAFLGLDALHAFYHLNQKELAAAHVIREAMAEERDRKARENPPKAPDIEVNIWPVKSQLNAR